MNWQETREELKKTWLLFLLFGFFFLIISAFINAGINNWVNNKMQGPPCRIDFSEEKFPWNISTDFKLPFLFINLRDKEILIEGFDNYCYWAPPEIKSNQNDENQVINQPIIKEISVPKELEKFPASQSSVKIAYGCRSPDKEGIYKIRIIAKTTSGICEGDILMEVKK